MLGVVIRVHPPNFTRPSMSLLVDSIQLRPGLRSIISHSARSIRRLVNNTRDAAGGCESGLVAVPRW